MYTPTLGRFMSRDALHKDVDLLSDNNWVTGSDGSDQADCGIRRAVGRAASAWRSARHEFSHAADRSPGRLRGVWCIAEALRNTAASTRFTSFALVPTMSA